MSIEPTCNFCGASDKFRCRTRQDANDCSLFKNYVNTVGDLRKCQFCNWIPGSGFQPCSDTKVARGCIKYLEDRIEPEFKGEPEEVINEMVADWHMSEETKEIIRDGGWMDNIKIEIYMDFGTVYTYYVQPDKAREHADAIIKTGYRHTPEGSNDLEWYPPHRILKIKIENGGNSSYKDETRAT